MPKYTRKGSVELDREIDSHMETIVKALDNSQLAEHYLAVVLLGGYGRGEGTPFIRSSNKSRENNETADEESVVQEPFNDYDLVVVVDRLNDAVRADLKHYENELTANIGLPVDLYPYLRSELSRCEFSLLNYELKYGHMVISGPENILAEMPDYRREAIPLSEGTRLLLNRGKLLLDIKRRISRGGKLDEEVRTRFIKFLFKANLAMGDCALLIEGLYDISYARKNTLVCEAEMDGLDVRQAVVDGYRRAIAFKEWGDFRDLAELDVAEEFERVRSLFIKFYHWYESKRLGGECENPFDHYRLLYLKANECGWMKAAIYNILWLKGRFFKLRAWQAASHPRLRMYAVMPLLIGRDSPASEASRMLALAKEDFEQCAQEFLAMQKRFS